MPGHGRYGRRSDVRLDGNTVPESRYQTYHPRGQAPRRTEGRTRTNGNRPRDRRQSQRYDRPHPGDRARSASPSRRDDQHRYRQREPPPPPPPVVQEQKHFKDPFQEIDKHQGRILNEGKAFQGAEYEHRSPENKSPREKIIEDFIHEMGRDKIEPKDVPGKAIRDMLQDKFRKVSRNMGVVVAHVDSREYEEKFKDPKWCKTLEELSKDLVPGLVCSISIADHLADRSVEVDDPCRVSHPNGALIGKIRTVVVLQVVGNDMEVYETTSFKDAITPPLHKIREYVLLKHESESPGSYTPPPYGVPTVQYAGNNHLTKMSYFRRTRPHWISLTNARIAVEGNLLLKDLDSLANVCNLPAGHALRIQAEAQRRELRRAQLHH